MSASLSFLDDRVRSLTEDLIGIQWAVLYHFLPGRSSFFFRRNGNRVDLSHLHYPHFFQAILAAKQEITMNPQGNTLDENNIRSLIFSSNVSLDHPVTAVPVFGDGGEALACILMGVKNPLPVSYSPENQARERKKITQLSQVLGKALAWHHRSSAGEATIRYQDRDGSPPHFKCWIDKVMKGIQADDYALYWVGDTVKLLSSQDSMEHNLQIGQFHRYWNPQLQVAVWNQKKITVHDTLKEKLGSLLNQQDYPSMVFAFPIPAGISGKIQPGNKHAAHLAIEFSRKSPGKRGKKFSESDYFFAMSSHHDMKKILEKNEVIASLSPLLSQEKNADPFQIDVYHKNQLTLISARIFLATDHRVVIKTDIKPGPNLGKAPVHFKYFHLENIPHEKKYAALTALDYFLFHALDNSDYYHKIKDFFTQGLKIAPPSSYVFFDLDCPKVAGKPTDKNLSVIGTLSRGFHFLYYNFGTGSLKKLPDYGYRFVLHPKEDDILIAIPNTSVKTIKEDLLKQLENEIVVSGHAHPGKLVSCLTQSLGHQVQEILMIKKKRMDLH